MTSYPACVVRRSRTRVFRPCLICRDRSDAFAAGCACDQRAILENDEESERPSNDDEPFAALAFKIATDPFRGYADFFPGLFRYICSPAIRFITR